MNNDRDLTYSQAIEQVMLHNGYFAPLKVIYNEIWNYKVKSKIIGITPENTIQERVQRDNRFTRIAKGVYALADFMKDVEEKDIGFFTVENDEVVFKTNRKPERTERLARQKVRIGQRIFRKNLLREMERCPITGIDDKRILIASHIKPWVHSNDEERLNTKNGILLSPLFDKLFDKDIGLITFTDEKRILISNKISQENILRLNIVNNQEVVNLDLDGREEFLEYHRKVIFQG